MKMPLLFDIRAFVLVATTILLFMPRESCAISNQYLGEVTVSVQGAKRTEPRYVEALVKSCLEKAGYQTWESIDRADLAQCIKNAKVFESVDIAVTPPEIKVTVSDRWTLIPIPSVYSSGGKRSVGLFVFESNFLGLGKVVGAGGAATTEGNTYSLIYRDPSVMFTDFTFSAIAGRSATEVDAYDRTSTIYAYRKNETGIYLSPGYRITPRINGSISLGYTSKQYSPIGAFTPPAGYSSTSVGARLSYSNSDYKLFYNDGFSGDISWNRQVSRTDGRGKVSSVRARLEWGQVLFEKHALQLALQASSQSSDVGIGDVSNHGRTRGYRGIQPAGLWAREIVTASMDYQIPIVHWGHGTVTVAPFVDYATYKPFFAGTARDYTAYGVGAYYFMNRINLPGVGLVVGNNDKFMGGFVTISIGMAFD